MSFSVYFRGLFRLFLFFFKQKTAYEMRISDWSSDVCSSDLPMAAGLTVAADRLAELAAFLDARFARRLAEIDYRPALGIDGALRPRGASLELDRKSVV